MRNLGLSGIVLLFGTNLGVAYSWDEVQLTHNIGSGAHAVLFVLDAWPDSSDADSFVFAYHFDDTQITGLQLMDALVAADIGFSYTDAGGGYVTNIWYDDGIVIHHLVDDYPATWISYWVSADFGETWEFAMAGPGLRVLFDGDTDGRTVVPNDNLCAPVTPLWPRAGDMNCDGSVTFLDINPFVAALTDPVAYGTNFPGCRIEHGDINHDGAVDLRDINPFLLALIPDAP
jgi:hypothetical protein